MNKDLLKISFLELKKKKYDCFLFKIANENLYEFTRKIDNYVVELSGFTGDTAYFAILKEKAYLLIDGRFTVQAKKEVKNKKISIIEISREYTVFDFISEHLSGKKVLAFNPKRISASFVKKVLEDNPDIKISLDEKFINDALLSTKKDCFNMSSAPLFLLDKKYVTKTSKVKISELINAICENEGATNKKKITYVTSSLEEIAYLTNLRYKFCDIDMHGVLFDSFLIVGAKKSKLYIKDYLEEDAFKYITKSGIEVFNYNDFYKDIKKISGDIYFDPKINNFLIFKTLTRQKANVIVSPLLSIMSIKDKKEIAGLKLANIYDGVAITKSIYDIRKKVLNNKIETLNEYKVKNLVDKNRVEVGKNNYLCPSFDTIVAYKENAAICHYIPSKFKCKKLKAKSILLIDSGGHYKFGSTDITRTISLYKNPKDVPFELKKHYTLVLNSMLNLAKTKFLYGLTATELDILARANLYSENLDYNHGTGHGIGYISNIHEGPNSMSPGFKDNSEMNILEIGQLQSDEPGLYFEHKYGIRLENDLIIVADKENQYGQFLKFENLTLCPFDRDLIDFELLDRNVIGYLNEYNKLVYDKINKYLNKEEKKWLKYHTMEVKK